MKFTKTYGVFLLAFAIGCISVFTYIFSTNNKTKEQKVKVIKPINVEPKAEVLEENLDYFDRNDTKHKIKLIETGEGFHGDEIIAKNNEKWLALLKQEDSLELKYVKVKVKRVNDPIVDDYERQKTGKSVSVKAKNEPFFLLKNSNTLKEGKVDSISRIGFDNESFKLGYERKFTINNLTFTLKVKKGLNKQGEKIIALVLSDGRKSQVLHSLKYWSDEDYLGSVVWVGDLDRDGKPDFYLDLYYHYNVVWKNLFLSTDTENEKIIKKVAEFRTVGC